MPGGILDVKEVRDNLKYGRYYRWWANRVVAHPGRFLALGWLLPALFAGIVWGTVGAPAIGTDFSTYMKTDGVVSDNHDAFNAAFRMANTKARRLSAVESMADLPDVELMDLDVDSTPGEAGDTAALRDLKEKEGQQRNAEWMLDLYYRARVNGALCDADREAPGRCNVLTPQRVVEVRNFEQALFALPGFDTFCMRTSKGVCRKPVSATNFWYGQRESTDAARFSLAIQPTGQNDHHLNVPMVVQRLVDSEYKWYFDSRLDERTRSAEVLRARVFFGVPLEGYESRSDRYNEQRDAFHAWALKELLPYLSGASTESLQVLYSEPTIRDAEVRGVVIRDGTLALASFFFIVVFSTFQMKSLLPAVAGVFTIALSFPVSVALLSLMGIERFAVINILSLFLILGIGADNLYVLSSYWAANKECGEVDRLMKTLRAGGKAVMVASTTTATSVLANCASTIAPVRTFGVFMGLCVFANLFLTLLTFPALLVVASRLRLSPRGPQVSTNPTVPVGANQPATSQPADSFRGFQPPARKWDWIRWDWASATKGVMRRRLRILGFAAVLVAGGLTGALVMVRVAEEPPVFFTPGSHNVGDLLEVEKAFNNRSTWVDKQESQPMYVCKGCTWDEEAGTFAGCQWVGAACRTAPCSLSRFQCQNRGVCEATGLCRCYAGFTGPDCGETTQVQEAVAACDPEAPTACSENGLCSSGECWCYAGFTGADCSQRTEAEEGCVHEPWSSWGSCITTSDADCGPGKQSRHRDARRGCGERQVESQPCSLRPCCATLDWSNWGSCVGCSLRSRSRTFRNPAAGAQRMCQGTTLSEEEDCSDECPEHCDLGDWVAAGACSVTCGMGKRDETRTVAAAAGHVCADAVAERAADCDAGPCPCEAEDWVDDGGCSTTCGVGTKTQRRMLVGDCEAGMQAKRTVECVGPPCECADDEAALQAELGNPIATCAGFAGDKGCKWNLAAEAACPVSCNTCHWCADEAWKCVGSGCRTAERSDGNTLQWYPLTCTDCTCNAQATSGTDCTSVQWAEWSACSATCGPGARTRQRAHTDCMDREVEDCTLATCPEQCTYGDWNSWGPCDVSCGKGFQTRTRSASSAWCMSNGENEEQQDCEEPACAVPCPDDWAPASGAAGQCSVTCGGGTRTEERVPGGWTPSATCEASRAAPCGTEPCGVDCELGEWQTDGGCSASCGGGEQVELRSVLVEGRNGVSCPAPSDPERRRTNACNEQACPSRKVAEISLTLDGVDSLTVLHLHRITSLVASKVGLPTSSVVSNGAVETRMLEGRGLQAVEVKVKIRTEASEDSESEARGLIQQVLEYVNSEALAQDLQLTGFFSGLTGVGVVTTRVVADEDSWAGVKLPPVELPNRDSPDEALFNDELAKAVWLPDGAVLRVNLLLGVEGLDRKQRSVRFPTGEPQLVGAGAFDSAEAQLHLLKVCDLQSASGLVKKLSLREVLCFVDDFKAWLEKEQLGTYPVDSAQGDFGSLVAAWLQSDDGKDLTKEWPQHFGFVDGELRWVRISVLTNVAQDAPPKVVLATMHAFNEYVDLRNREAPDDTLRVVPSSQQWVIAETEDGIMNSAVRCAVISLSCALVAILMFTGSAWLACFVSLTVFMIVTCQAATMFCILRWTFGPVEAIGLILFVGFSVDYTLHVAEAFHHAPPPKVENAYKHVGRAVTSAAITTAGSAFFLFFCTVNVFFNFGLAIMLNSMWSLLFALVVFPALLTVLPARYHEAAYGAFAEEDEDFGAGRAPPQFAGFGQPQSLGAPRDAAGAAPMPHLEPEDDFALRPDAFERPELALPEVAPTRIRAGMAAPGGFSRQDTLPGPAQLPLRANVWLADAQKEDSEVVSTGAPSIADSAGGNASGAASDATRRPSPSPFASL